MFVNGDVVLIVIKMLAISSLLLSLALVAHLVWLRRLAGSQALGTLGPAARVALLALAAATPVVSFYGVGAVRCLRHLSRHRGLAGAAITVLGMLLAAGLGVLVLAGLHQPDVLSRLPGLLLLLVLPCAVLGMACQILAGSRPARAAWMAVAATIAAALFLLV